MDPGLWAPEAALFQPLPPPLILGSATSQGCWEAVVQRAT